MASQIKRVTGDRRIGARKQTAAIRGQLSQISGIMAAKQAKQIAEKQIAMDKARLAEEKRQYKKNLALERRSGEVELGMTAAKAGHGALASGLGGFGDVTFNSFFGSSGTAGGAKSGAVMAARTGTGGSWYSGLGDFKLSSGIGSGLVGFGAGKLLGGKNKLKKIGLGMGVGALAGMFGQGGFSLGGAMGGAAFGGLGGLLS